MSIPRVQQCRAVLLVENLVIAPLSELPAHARAPGDEDGRQQGEDRQRHVSRQRQQRHGEEAEAWKTIFTGLKCA
jgi:hypothetical protein